jgi:prepilin-type N-terminal cleavage/methylation domain-containing protein
MGNSEFKKGFTFIELLITLAIIAVLFVPVMQLFSHSLSSTSFSQDLISATNLAKWEMERLKNLNVTKKQLKQMGDSIYPPPAEEPLLMNKTKWRIERKIMQDSDPLEVRVSVFYDGQPTKPVVTLVTLIEDMFWEEIRPLR